jgi:signal transduction histidine kinase
MEQNLKILDLIINSLFPFSLVFNQRRQILLAGRSFQKLVRKTFEYPSPIESWFENPQVFFKGPLGQTELHRGETQIRGVNLSFRFLEIPLDQDTFLLALSPTFSEPKTITNLGLNFSDFSDLDPSIDFMMVWQSMKMTESDLQERNRDLWEKNRNLRVLSATSLLATQSLKREDLISKYIALLCQEMGWQEGACFHIRLIEKSLLSPLATNSTLTKPLTEADLLRWKTSLSRKSDIQIEHVMSPDQLKTLYYELICRMTSRRGPAFDQVLILRSAEPPPLGSASKEFYKEANTFVVQALDQIELLSESESQRAQVISHSKMATLGEMAGGIAHEINNPLAIIKARIHILEANLQKNPSDSEKVQKDLMTIKNTIDRISKIIRGLKVFSRTADLDPLEPTKIDHLVAETLDLVQAKIRAAGADLRVSIPDKLMIKCRPVQISQVLMNLIMNAHDAVLEKEQKWISIEARKLDGLVQISVTDSGHGIPEPIAEKLMQPFFTTKGPGKGTGLGLSISKGIIESHNGRLSYSTHEGHTRFTIEIPTLETSEPTEPL